VIQSVEIDDGRMRSDISVPRTERSMRLNRNSYPRLLHVKLFSSKFSSTAAEIYREPDFLREIFSRAMPMQ
jgi:hypothetical protein